MRQDTWILHLTAMSIARLLALACSIAWESYTHLDYVCAYVLQVAFRVAIAEINADATILANHTLVPVINRIDIADAGGVMLQGWPNFHLNLTFESHNSKFHCVLGLTLACLLVFQRAD
jgi:uncharacterized protein (DUF2062 family)